MFKKKTLIIVGAGASFEVGLPIGRELKHTIASLLDIRWHLDEQIKGDTLIVDSLRILVRSGGSKDNINAYIKAAHIISGAMPQAPSIDNFIDAHNGNNLIECCGKLSIVRAILKAERESKLYFETNSTQTINFAGVEDTWFNMFFQVLTENCRKNDLAKRFDSLAMVIFNYDRCIEHFLFNAIKNFYQINADETAELINKIEIYHPYGQVGNLPWQIKNDSAVIDFGAEPNSKNLLSLSEGIRTFTEGTDPKSSEILAIRSHVQASEIVLFLGFAFHRLNMELLNPDLEVEKLTKPIKCFATAKGISDHNRDIIEEDLVRLIKSLKKNNVYLRNNLSCAGLFQEFRRSLSYS